MADAPQNAPEYQLYTDFVQSREYKRLTQGENAVFKDFDPQSPESLQQLRDYIYQDISPAFRKIDFADYKSLSISRFQIGLALQARNEYREKMAVAEPERRRTFAATTSKNGHVGRIKNFDPSRRIRC